MIIVPLNLVTNFHFQISIRFQRGCKLSSLNQCFAVLRIRDRYLPDINLRIIPTYSPILKIFKKSPLVYNRGSQKYGKSQELGKEPPVLHQLKEFFLENHWFHTWNTNT